MNKFSKKIVSVMLSVLLVLTVMPMSALSAKAETLDQAKANYVDNVNKMKNNGTVYTNTLNAYLKYIAACQPNAGQTEADELQAAVNAMEVFTPNKGNAQVSVNGQTATGYYSNVLWAESPTTLQYSNLAHGYIYDISGWFNSLKYGDDYFIYQPSAVVLYDGETDAKIPVLFAEQENEGRWAFRFGYVKETDGRLTGDWGGYTTVARQGDSGAHFDINVAWPTVTSLESVPKDITYDPDPDSDDGYIKYDAAAVHGSNSYFYNFKNSLVFNPGDSIYKKYASFRWDVLAWWYNQVTGNDRHMAQGETTLNTYNPVYVLNYKKLLDAIDAMIDKHNDNGGLLDASSSQFVKGAAANVFGALDNATQLNFNDTSKYNYAQDAEAAAKKASTDIDNAIKDLNSANSSDGDISTIATYIQKYETNMKKNPFRSDLEETYKLYLKAKECFDAYMFGRAHETGTTEQQNAFRAKVAQVATAFQIAVDNQKEFATATVDSQGNVTGYTAKDYTGTYAPSAGFFDNDTDTGSGAYTYYYEEEGAAANILYYPTVNASSPRAQYFSYNDTANTSQSSAMFMQLYYPENIVLLYNGVTNPKFPMMMRSGNKNTGWTDSVVYFSYLYPTVSAVSGKQYWGNKDAASSKPATFGDSTEWGIRQKRVYNNLSKTSEHYADYGWQGGGFDNKNSGTRPLNWKYVWSQDKIKTGDWTMGDDTGAIAGKSTIALDNDRRLMTRRFGTDTLPAAASSALEYKDTYFSTHSSEAYKNYPSIRWHLMWEENNYWFSTVLGVNSNINVVNTKPVTTAIESLINNSDVKDILNYVYLYDGDATDYITLLQKIDAIGDFDPSLYDEETHPNGYAFNNNTDGGAAYGNNKGVEDCVNDINNIVAEVAEVSDVITDEDTEGKVAPPADEDKKESTSTDTTNPDSNNWYGDLRNALLNPEEYDECSDDTAWSAYETALTNARAAISAASMRDDDTYYPASYENNTISYYAEELNAAKAAYLAAPGKHTFKYDNEDLNQNSEWECTNNSIHNHGTADMSAYNELEIAYHTIDPEAYDNFENLVAAKYDGNAYDDSSEEAKDYSDLSFKEVKTKKTKKGGNPQDFVDQGVMNLLEAINTAATENDREHLSSYKVNFNVQVAGEEVSRVLINQEYKYGERPTLNAAESPVFRNNNGQCYKWSIKIGDGKEQFIDSTSSVFDCTVQRDCTITAYANKAIAGDQAKISIIGPTGSTLDVVHAAKSASVAFSFDNANNKAVATIGGVNYEITSTPSYTVTGITLSGANDEDYAGQSGLTVQGLLDALNAKELRIKPLKTKAFKDTTYTVTANGTGGTVNNNNDTGTETSLSEIAYDTKVRINYTPDTSKGTYYGMVINEAEMAGGSVARYIPITYADEYYFRAISDMNIYPLYQRTLDGGAKAYYVDDGSADGERITNGDTLYRLQHKLPFVISFMDTDNVTGKFFFRCLYTHGLPENIEVTEAGWVAFRCTEENILPAINALSPEESDLTVDNAKTVTEDGYTGRFFKAASTKLNTAEVRETHQYSFSSKDSAHTYILGRGYVKYEYTFSESVEHDGSTTTVNAPIEAISYGRADFYLNSNS